MKKNEPYRGLEPRSLSLEDSVLPLRLTGYPLFYQLVFLKFILFELIIK